MTAHSDTLNRCSLFKIAIHFEENESCIGQQLNGNTHWLDGSQVYGSNAAESTDLRQGRDGLMKTTLENGQHLLPIIAPCDKPTCFVAGNERRDCGGRESQRFNGVRL